MSAKNIITSALVAAIVAAGTSYAFNRMGLLRTVVEVPSLIALPVASARGLVDAHGLLLVLAEEREDESAPPGQILVQRPLGGSRVYQGESVSVVVAKAPTLVKVPAVVGKPLGEAKLLIEASHLIVGAVVEEPHGTTPVGSVVSQSRLPQTETKIDSTIDLVVSKGTPMTPVPKVVGRGQSAAKKEILKAGFTVGKIHYRADESRDEGVVLEQTPAGDEPAPKDAPVDLVVNASP